MRARGDLWSEDYPGVSKWMEAQTDRLDYDLRGWEPVEYEYLKAYPAVNSELRISEYTEDGDLIRMCNGYYRIEPAGVTSVVTNPKGRPAMQFPGATKTSTQRNMSHYEVEDAIAAHKKLWEENERCKPKKAPLQPASSNPSSPISDSPFNTRGSSTRSSSFDSRFYQSPYLRDTLIFSPSFQSRGKKEEDQSQKSKFKVERTSVRSLYQSPIFKDSLEHEKASRLKEGAAERLKVLRSLKKEAEDDLFDLLSRRTSISRRTSVVGSPSPTRMPSISAWPTTDKRKISPTTYETMAQGSSIKPATENKELTRYISQP
ncbi:hypothetical protein BY996DRAFT_6515622 [Phakopsora pachyrhizi]|nr:hypothetical protein BY996DRAFT_6515622 [Phakopsora pachyrhizi]